MKLLLLILVPIFSLAQASTYEKGDSTWLTSSDTGKAKVYRMGTLMGGIVSVTLTQAYIDSLKEIGKTIHTGVTCLSEAIRLTDSLNQARAKYDTIGPIGRVYPKDSKEYAYYYYDEDALKSPVYDKAKYDTIGPVWKQVSDTGAGYNPVMAMQMYEVRIYKSEYLNITVAPHEFVIPEHFAWLDMGKKRFKLKVW